MAKTRRRSLRGKTRHGKTRRYKKTTYRSVKKGGKVPTNDGEKIEKKRKLEALVTYLKGKGKICPEFNIQEFYSDPTANSKYFDNNKCEGKPVLEKEGSFVLNDEHCIPIDKKKYHLTERRKFLVQGDGENFVIEDESDPVYSIPFERTDADAGGGRRNARRGKTMRSKTMRGKTRRSKKTTQRGGLDWWRPQAKLRKYVEELKKAGVINENLNVDNTIFTKQCSKAPNTRPGQYENVVLSGSYENVGPDKNVFPEIDDSEAMYENLNLPYRHDTLYEPLRGRRTTTRRPTQNEEGIYSHLSTRRTVVNPVFDGGPEEEEEIPPGSIVYTGTEEEEAAEEAEAAAQRSEINKLYATVRKNPKPNGGRKRKTRRRRANKRRGRKTKRS